MPDIRGLLSSVTLPLSDSPRLDSELILAHVLNKPRSWLLAHPEDIVDAGSSEAYCHLMGRRQQGEPVAYLLGYRDFWKSRLNVRPGALVPRPETELLVELALDAGPDEQTVVDLGTGSGAIAVSLAKERPSWHVVATDLDSDALAVATDNSTNLPNISLCRADWLETFAPSSINMIVCNPPYISECDTHLNALQYEPQRALVSGSDGLRDIFTVSEAARRVLSPNGLLLLEHGYQQQQDVSNYLTQLGYRHISRHNDVDGNPRVVAARSSA